MHNDTHVDISVEDTGIGISDKDISIIFEEFRQADGSYSREYGGTGLGLYLVKKLTEQLHGRVLVKSNPGQGSLFTVRLPIKFNS
jgi:signal transduction histidine kinase